MRRRGPRASYSLRSQRLKRRHPEKMGLAVSGGRLSVNHDLAASGPLAKSPP